MSAFVTRLIPCFDDDDYANEDRDYNNYCFCKKDSAKWQKIKRIETTRRELLPDR